MTVFLAEMKENMWEFTESWVVGIYSTKEKAENAILNELRGLDISVLSLEIYDAMRDTFDNDYDYFITKMEVE